LTAGRSLRQEVWDRQQNEKKVETMNRDSKSMSAVAVGVLLGFFGGAQAMAQPANRSREEAGVIVEGVVREVFRTTRTGGLAYLVQLDVSRSELGRGYRGTARVAGPAPGDPLYIYIEQPGLDGGRLSGGDLRMPLPEQQTTVRAFVNPRSQGGWENACPEWYEPIAPGAVARNPGAPGPAPAQEVQNPANSRSALDLLGVRAEQAQASGRLVFKVSEVLPGTPAANAGIEKGDAIIGVNGAPITGVDEFAATLKREGPTVKLVVLNTRTGQPALVPVDLTPATRGDTRQHTGASRRKVGIRGEPVRLGLLGRRTAFKITEVQPDSPGKKAGLEIGDVIVSANGASVSDLDSIEAAAKAGGPVLKVTLHDVRSGNEVAVAIPLGDEQPTPAGAPSAAPAGSGSIGSLGVTVEAATADSLPLVKVARVTPGSPADNAGIQPGDAIVALNGSVIFAPDLLEESLKKAGQSFTLTVLDSKTGKKNQVKINLDH
jgi:serine protease Do